jgi:hypothetical protein
VDVPDAGRVAVFQDPQGATFGVWQAGKQIGAKFINEVGTLCWTELATSDEKGAQDFYSSLFGWKAETMPMEQFQYTIFKNGEQSAGGMYTITEQMKGMPPNWTVYFAVADCDQSVQTAQAAGANVLVPPTDIPEVGRFATLTDPQGATFAIIKLARM